MKFTTPRACPVVTAVLLLLACCSASAGTASDMFSNFDRAMATFDPVGKYVRKPIERAVPRLTVRGFMRQNYDMLVHRSGPVGFVNQDFRALQLQNLFELETNFHVAEGLDKIGRASCRERV